MQRNDVFFLAFCVKNNQWVQHFAGFRDVFYKNVPNNLHDSFLVGNFACTINSNIVDNYENEHCQSRFSLVESFP